MRQIEADALDFTTLLRDHDGLAWGQAAAEPLALTRRLMAQRHQLHGLRAFCGISWADTIHPDHADAIRFSSYCGTGRNRMLQAHGALDILPIHYSQFEAALAPRVDVLLLQVARGRERDSFSYALACEYLAPLVKSARLVVAELNDAAPSTPAMVTLERADIDILVPVSRRPLMPPQARADAVQDRIAQHVAAMVPDGAILQIGLGALPAAVLARLAGHRHLGLHSGLFTDGMAALIRSGAVDNSTKADHRGRSVAGLIAGGPDSWSLCHESDAVLLAPSHHSHSAKVLAALPRFVAINAGLEVALSGQVNAEMAGDAYVGAVGGGTDFARGAGASPGGLPILALPSARQGKAGRLMSTIVTALHGPVSLSRADAGVIVTEEGVADLRGASLSQRAARLIAISHPDLREDLARKARDLGQLRPHQLRRD